MLDDWKPYIINLLKALLQIALLQVILRRETQAKFSLKSLLKYNTLFKEKKRVHIT